MTDSHTDQERHSGATADVATEELSFDDVHGTTRDAHLTQIDEI